MGKLGKPAPESSSSVPDSPGSQEELLSGSPPSGQELSPFRWQKPSARALGGLREQFAKRGLQASSRDPLRRP
ncbi:hypothetical protein CK820_G0034990 [Pan troglodytes]|uniref:Uncharacterized protein n=1 Tax=Pan troglodytes TaxID=9598 RepID=A0A2J8KXK8_PANTR|nr:hypothetical protein CK820_G0034990 [Pan troglodytes]